MGSMSLMHWLVVLIVVLVFFGSGRVSNVMKEVGKGIRGFKEGMTGVDEKRSEDKPQQLPPKE